MNCSVSELSVLTWWWKLQWVRVSSLITSSLRLLTVACWGTASTWKSSPLLSQIDYLEGVSTSSHPQWYCLRLAIVVAINPTVSNVDVKEFLNSRMSMSIMSTGSRTPPKNDIDGWLKSDFHEPAPVRYEFGLISDVWLRTIWMSWHWHTQTCLVCQERDSSWSRKRPTWLLQRTIWRELQQDARSPSYALYVAMKAREIKYGIL